MTVDTHREPLGNDAAATTHHNPTDGQNHQTRTTDDGPRAICWVAPPDVEWTDATGPVNCHVCRAVLFVHDLQEALDRRRQCGALLPWAILVGYRLALSLEVARLISLDPTRPATEIDGVQVLVVRAHFPTHGWRLIDSSVSAGGELPH